MKKILLRCLAICLLGFLSKNSYAYWPRYYHSKCSHKTKAQCGSKQESNFDLKVGAWLL